MVLNGEWCQGVNTIREGGEVGKRVAGGGEVGEGGKAGGEGGQRGIG